MTSETAAPSAALDAATWQAAHADLVKTLRELITIPSVDPVDPSAPDMELVAARAIAAMLH